MKKQQWTTSTVAASNIYDQLKNWPRISIVTPSYNQGEFIEHTILSVLGQNYPNLEYIIIDGGSTDETVAIIKKYEARITYWVSEKDEGQYDAINKGFKKCSGQIMSYINSDDVYTHRAFFSIAQIFNDYPEIEWIGGVSNYIDEMGRSVWVGAKPQWNKHKFMKNQDTYLQQEGVFWRKSVWERAGGYISTQHKLASDLELWSRFFTLTVLYIFPGLLGSFRIRSFNQKSLDYLNEYHTEGVAILANMAASEKELKQIKMSKTLAYRILKKIDQPLLWQLFGYNTTRKEVNKYPNELYFDRKLGKFCLKN